LPLFLEGTGERGGGVAARYAKERRKLAREREVMDNRVGKRNEEMVC
jgi:hypothetical protein